MMSMQQPKTFFIRLKETCKKIDQDLLEVKEKLYELPGNEDLASKKICEIRDKIKTLNKEGYEIKSILEPRLSHSADFIQHMKDLISETEDLISKQEKYLEQYGYKPLEMVPEAVTASEDQFSSPVKESSQANQNGSTTPNALEFGLVSRSLPNPSSMRKSSIEDLIPPKMTVLSDSFKAQVKDKDSTPTLPSELLANKVLHTDEETPPVPELYYIPALPATPKLEL